MRMPEIPDRDDWRGNRVYTLPVCNKYNTLKFNCEKCWGEHKPRRCEGMTLFKVRGGNRRQRLLPRV